MLTGTGNEECICKKNKDGGIMLQFPGTRKEINFHERF